MKSPLINQPTSETVRKVRYAASAATIAAPASLIVAAVVVHAFPFLAGSEEAVALIVSAAITGLATWWTGYQTRERREL